MSNLPNASMGHILTIEVPPRFIALCHDTAITPQVTLHGLTAMRWGLRCDVHNRLPPLESDTPHDRPDAARSAAEPRFRFGDIIAG